jgi:ribosomal protein S12 methylthiotransferase accessory factor
MIFHVSGLRQAAQGLAFLDLAPSAADACLRIRGLTRIAELTGLDEVKVPVWTCIRPQSKTTAVSFGKGLTAPQAQISAIMEALESACAEDRAALVAVDASLRQMLTDKVNIVGLSSLARCRFAEIDQDRVMGWVKGVSLSTGKDVFAPFDLVGMDYTEAYATDGPGFAMTSIGLGAGKSLEDATRHALMELIEHDAIAMLEIFPGLSHALPESSSARGYDPSIDQALDMFSATGEEPIFRSVSHRFGLPVVMCSIPGVLAGKSRVENICAGFACRETVAQAALAALLEAAQVRMTMIAGAREDLTDDDYALAEQLALPTPNKATLDRDHSLFVVPAAAVTTRISVKEILQRLAAAGIENIHAFTLSKPDEPFHVVRVLAEGLDAADLDANSNLGFSAIDMLLRLRLPDL